MQLCKLRFHMNPEEATIKSPTSKSERVSRENVNSGIFPPPLCCLCGCTDSERCNMAWCWARGQTEGVCPGASSWKLSSNQSLFQNQNPPREGSYRNADMTSSLASFPSHNINTGPWRAVCVWSLRRTEKSWADWQPAGCVLWPDWWEFNLLIVVLKFSY